MVALVLSGCVPLPYLETLGVEGKVVDAASHRPIGGAIAQVQGVYSVRRTQTSFDGRFRIRPHHRIYWYPFLNESVWHLGILSINCDGYISTNYVMYESPPHNMLNAGEIALTNAVASSPKR